MGDTVDVRTLPDSMLFGRDSRYQLQIQSWYLKASEEFREEIVERGLKFWREQGFPFPKVTNKKIKDYHRRLTAYNVNRIHLPEDALKNISTGVGIPNHFHPHRWDVKCGKFKPVMLAWNTDHDLRRMVRKAFDMAGIASATIMRSMASTSHTQTVANFLPCTAKFIYQNFSKVGDLIFDPSAGYGGRAFGLSTLHKRNYWATDPDHRTIAGNMKMVEKLRELNLVTSELRFIQSGAEEMMPLFESDMFQLVFTSPPYFDIEQYGGDNPMQSYNKFPGYDGWLNGFLRILLKESRRITKPGGWTCINIADVREFKTTEDIVKIAKEEGLSLRHVLRMRMIVRPYHREKFGPYKYEPIFCFQNVDHWNGEQEFIKPVTMANKDKMRIF